MYQLPNFRKVSRSRKFASGIRASRYNGTAPWAGLGAVEARRRIAVDDFKSAAPGLHPVSRLDRAVTTKAARYKISWAVRCTNNAGVARKSPVRKGKGKAPKVREKCSWFLRAVVGETIRVGIRSSIDCKDKNLFALVANGLG